MALTKEQREGYECYIWDAYKDAHGIRPRFLDFDAMSDEELVSYSQRLSQEVEEAIDRERVQAEIAYNEYEASVEKLMREQRIDRHTAMRWLFEADEVATYMYQDVEHFFWKLGVSFEKARELFDEYNQEEEAACAKTWLKSQETS